MGQQQRVELLKALYRQARLLILDEPTAVLAPQAVTDLFRILRGMRAQGKTIVIVAHKLSEVLEISDEVTVMRDGRVVGHRRTAETNAAELARLMVGRDVLLRVVKPEAKPGGAVLSVRELSLKGAEGGRRLDGVSFEVRAGEILGVAGVEGNGQTELIETLAGLVDRRSLTGAINLGGTDVTALSARGGKSGGSPTSPRTASGGACCSTSTSRRTPSSASTSGRRSRSGRPARGSTARRPSGARRRSSRPSTSARRTSTSPRARSPAATSRS